MVGTRRTAASAVPAAQTSRYHPMMPMLSGRALLRAGSLSAKYCFVERVLNRTKPPRADQRQRPVRCRDGPADVLHGAGGDGDSRRRRKWHDQDPQQRARAHEHQERGEDQDGNARPPARRKIATAVQIPKTPRPANNTPMATPITFSVTGGMAIFRWRLRVKHAPRHHSGHQQRSQAAENREHSAGPDSDPSSSHRRRV